MKPIELLISGLNSFRQEQIIDFSLISDTGLFGIFGPTGSGKSSILDAITLSLYGRVERSDANRVGIINQQEEKIHVKFVFELTLANNRQRYYVERVYNRLDELRVRSTIARLVRVDAGQDIVLADREKEVTKGVEELLGLTVDDFTRAVVLPQGKFAEFLTLKAQERRPMLERLFHLDEYGKKLKDKAQRRENELKQKRDEIITKQAMLSHATKENLAALEHRLQNEETRRQEANQKLESFLADFKNIERNWGIQAELTGIKLQLKAFEERAGYISVLRLKKENAEKAAHIEPTLVNFRKIEQQLAAVNQTIAQLIIRQQQLTVEVSDYRLIYEERKSACDKYFPVLTDRKYKLQEAIEDAKELNAIQELIAANTKEKQAITTEYTDLTKQLGQLEQSTNLVTAEITGIKENLIKIQISPEERRKLDNALQIRSSLIQIKKDLAAKNDELILLNARISEKELIAEEQLKKTSLTLKEYQGLEQELGDLQKGKHSEDNWLMAEKNLLAREHVIEKIFEQQNEIAKLNGDNRQLDLRIAAVTAEIKRIRLQVKELEELVASKRNSLNELEQHQKINVAVALAKDLDAGTPCIVCGSIHHPKPITEDQLDKSSEQKSAEITKELAELESQLIKDKIDLKTAENNLYANEELRSSLILDLERKGQRLKELVAVLPADYQHLQGEELKKKIAQEKEQQLLIKQEIDAWSLQNEKLVARSKALKEKADKEQQDYKITLSEINMLIERKNIVVDSINQLTEMLTDVESKWQNSKNDWEIETIEQVKEEIDQMDINREELQGRLKELETITEQNQQKIKLLVNRKQLLENQLSALEINLAKDSDRLGKLTEKYNLITEGKKATDLLAETTGKMESLKERLVIGEKQLQVKTSELNLAENSLNANQAVMENLQIQHQEIKDQLNRLMKNYQIPSLANLTEYLLTKDEVDRLTKEIKTYDENLSLLISKQAELKDKIAENEIAEEDWIKQNEVKALLERELDESKHQYGELSFQYKELTKDYKLWSSMEADRKTLQRELDVAAELNQVLRGNGFIDFVAQEYLYNITLIASGKLKQLTRNRYSLDIDQEGGFKLIDDLNGGLSRPVQSLSGGETFLTSLSLALALSSQIQLKGGQMLEFFFLDEGFGSLDSDLLDTVMMTLEKLHAGHILIGIISHVPELQSRINRRLIVTPADSKGKGSSIRVEYS